MAMTAGLGEAVKQTRPRNPGHMTLESLAEADGLARWTIDQFKSHLGSTVLEAGCGIGNMTRHLMDRSCVVAADIDPENLASVQARLGHHRELRVIRCDLQDPSLYDELGMEFDSVLCVNVLEHLDEPEAALREFNRSLRRGGNALILVPAHPWLFSTADEALGHRRRYTRTEIREAVERAGLAVHSLYEFNRLGVLGWWTNKLLKRSHIGPWQARVFEKIVPLARIVDRLGMLPGLSIIVIARKP